MDLYFLDFSPQDILNAWILFLLFIISIFKFNSTRQRILTWIHFATILASLIVGLYSAIELQGIRYSFPLATSWEDMIHAREAFSRTVEIKFLLHSTLSIHLLIWISYKLIIDRVVKNVGDAP
jgi:hypothetical protein